MITPSENWIPKYSISRLFYFANQLYQKTMWKRVSHDHYKCFHSLASYSANPCQNEQGPSRDSHDCAAASDRISVPLPRGNTVLELVHVSVHHCIRKLQLIAAALHTCQSWVQYLYLWFKNTWNVSVLLRIITGKTRIVLSLRMYYDFEVVCIILLIAWA